MVIIPGVGEVVASPVVSLQLRPTAQPLTPFDLEQLSLQCPPQEVESL